MESVSDSQTELRTPPFCVCITQDRTYHVLESLASSESCVIVAFLANAGVPGGQEALVEMFEVLLTGVRDGHSQVSCGTAILIPGTIYLLHA